MDNENGSPERDDEVLADTTGEELLDRLISDEMGERIAQIMRSARHAQEAWHRSRNPGEGLRERKRRLTRQLISDAATTMFATRGFDNVKVSEVADRVGVSEKTIYNYFPTKESLVLDTADEAVERMARALRERGPDESLTAAVVRAIEEDTERFAQAPEDLIEFIPLFLGMIDSTPALRAAWLELHDRLANVARDELAAQAGIDPRDPEPMAAGRALAGLAEVSLESWARRIREGLRGEELRRVVDDDLQRAARLLETGLWSFNVPRSQRAKQQAMEAARAADDARAQVLKALRQARAAWAEVRREGGGFDARSMRQEIQQHFREAQRQAMEHAREQAKQHAQQHADRQAQLQAERQAQRQADRAAQRQARDARRGGRS
jgi:AcrR family transcriptional regulator